jgi:hypothetical protein
MKQGRNLELLLKRIQEFQVPDSVVKSPEFVPDVDTGTKREVDITVRQKKGNSEIFIAIECRDRGSVQDIQWVEQLITKKESIQADALIAVTSSDFTSPAQVKANKRGVILKKIISDVPKEIKRIINEIIVEFKFVQPRIYKVDIKVPDFFSDDLDNYKYSIKGVQRQFTFKEIVSVWNTPNLVRSICGKIDDFEKVKFVKLEFPTPGLFIADESRSYPNKSARFIYELNHKIIKLPLTSVMLYHSIEEKTDEAVIYQYHDYESKLSEIIHDIQNNQIRWDIHAKEFLKEGMVLIGGGLKSDVPIAVTMMQLDI